MAADLVLGVEAWFDMADMLLVSLCRDGQSNECNEYQNGHETAIGR